MSSADTYGTVSGLGLLYNVEIGEVYKGAYKEGEHCPYGLYCCLILRYLCN